MSDKSPLFISALELFAHAVELYATKRQRDLKFAILHLANAVELILKDAVLDLGESIYRQSGKETIGIWETFERLKQRGISVPGRQHIELLIDDRNAIQHRFGFPDERTTSYYLQEVRKFLKEFLNERYGLQFEDLIGEYLEREHLPLIGVAAPEDQVKALFKLSPATGILEAWRDIEHRLMSLSEAREEELLPHLAMSYLPRVIDALIKDRYLQEDAASKFEVITFARNAAAHARSDLDKQRWEEALEIYLELVKGLERAAREKFVFRTPTPDFASAVEVGAAFASAWLDGRNSEDVRSLLLKAPWLPWNLDSDLLRYSCRILNIRWLDEELKKAVRDGFWKKVRERGVVLPE